MNLKSSSLFILSMALVGFSGCSDLKSNDGLTFTNDMETVVGWSTNAPSNFVFFNNAHSGKYVCIIDSANIFGSTFEMKSKAIASAPMKRVTIGAWFNTQQNGSEPQIAIDIRDKDGNTIDWIAMPVKDVLKNTGDWTWAEMTVDLTPKNRNAVDNAFRVYAFNKSGAACLVDDMVIRFEK
jgi:hypothetical protein